MIVVSEQPQGRLFRRRRRANVKGGRQHEHKVRVSPEEEGRLVALAEAQRATVPRLLVESALAVADADGTAETSSQRRMAMEELFALHRLLAAISNNVNQIARATNATGDVQDEMVVTLQRVRQVATRIDGAIDGLSLR